MPSLIANSAQNVKGAVMKDYDPIMLKYAVQLGSSIDFKTLFMILKNKCLSRQLTRYCGRIFLLRLFYLHLSLQQWTL